MCKKGISRQTTEKCTVDSKKHLNMDMTLKLISEIILWMFAIEKY